MEKAIRKRERKIRFLYWIIGLLLGVIGGSLLGSIREISVNNNFYEGKKDAARKKPSVKVVKL